MAIFLALVHHPCLDRQGKVVTTALTNVDVHDLARSGRTFGAEALYIVTPVTLQLRMVAEITEHWTEGQASGHLRRKEALRRVTGVASLHDAAADVERRTGSKPLVAVTGAQMRAPTHSFAELRKRLREPGPPVLLVFGTGWGLTAEVIDAAEVRLPPIIRDPGLPSGDAGYNHLSVRAAAAIALDRLLGEAG